MSTFRTCPRCGQWHGADRSCDQQLALAALSRAGGVEQRGADVAENEAVHRYRARRGPREGTVNE
ncbi:MAG TPA: hypothetical protein VGL20_20985 [Candidatus Dormibacteraeota bacterium]